MSAADTAHALWRESDTAARACAQWLLWDRPDRARAYAVAFEVLAEMASETLHEVAA